MDDYISREAVLGVFGDIHPMDYNANAYVSKIKDIPAADVKPVVRGNWTMPLEDKEEIYGYVCECSNCGEKVIGNSYHDSETPICSYRFCPWCGADMREVKK